MTDKAILVNFNPTTGKRVGDINPREEELRGHPMWQDLDKGVELRLVLDDREITEQDGLVLLDGKEAINKAIDDNFKVKYYISDRDLYDESYASKDIDIDSLPDKMRDKLKVLKDDYSVKGISIIDLPKV